MPLLQHINCHSYEQEGSSAHKYCARESCDVTVGDSQNALTKVAGTVRAKKTNISTEEAQTLEENLKEQAADRKCKAAAQTVEQPASSPSYDPQGILIRTASINGVFQKVFLVTIRVCIS